MESTFGYFPLFINLKGKQILIIGGGKIATRRFTKLQSFGADITVLATEFSNHLVEREQLGEVRLRQRAYDPTVLDNGDLFLVIAATDDRTVNHEIGAFCREKKVLCIVSDNRDETDVYFPALVEDSDFLMGIVSKHGDHRSLRNRAEELREEKMKQTIKVGSRASRLAVKQAHLIMSEIKQAHPDIELELVTFTTKGDRILDKTIDEVGGKGLFMRELEVALRNKEIDFAVHSYKDIPYDENPDFPMVALSPRADTRDALILPKGLTEIPKGLPIGTSSVTRQAQLSELFPDIPTAMVRGDIFSRLEQLDNGLYGGLILAACGLKRMNLEERISQAFTIEQVIPSASQGILAIQGRAGGNYDYLACIHSQESELISLAERSLLGCLDQGGASGVAACATLQGKELELVALYVNEEGKLLRSKTRGPKAKAEQLAHQLAAELLEGKVRPWQ